jgi:pyruvate/2-oxoglutarate dehydrogenase complex dihydrolipoamide dehydrogenase (E3) component
MNIEYSHGSDYPGAECDREWRRLVFPDDWRNPAPKARYHLIVIGAGPAGLVTSIAAAGLGADVALIESTAMGGDCLNVGCVPSKALLAQARRSDANFDDAYRWLRRVRSTIAIHDSVQRFQSAGVDVFLGPAHFVDEHSVAVGDTTLSGRRIVIATGAHATIPDIPGLAESAPHTNETLFDMTAAPRSLAIVGAGAVGCELAQAFARLGIAVDLLDIADQVLPAMPAAAGTCVADALREDGVNLHLGSAPHSVTRDSLGFAIHMDDGTAGDKESGDSIERGRAGRTIIADELLVAAGRRPNTDQLNLGAAGVETDNAGRVVVDRYLRTSARHIFAAGDVCTAEQFTHQADAQARIVVQNALFAVTARADRLIIPRCVYTDPEVATVGASARSLETAGTRYDRYQVKLADLDRSRTEGEAQGFAEVLTRRGSGRILGATVVAHDAGEQIAGLCIAMSHGLGLGALARTVLPYPTRSEYLRRLGDEFNRSRLKPSTRKVLDWWFRWRR